MDTKDGNGATPLDLAPCDSTWGTLLERHNDVLTAVKADSEVLVSAASAHCVSLSASRVTVPAAALTSRAFFFWAPSAARAAIFVWARDTWIVQHAGTTEPFSRLPDDCAGDVCEFLELNMTRQESLTASNYCSSPEARTWVHAVIVAAVVVRISNSHDKT